MALAPGSGTSGAGLSDGLGSGAGGALGADLAAKAPADGHTLLLSTTAIWAILPGLKKDLPYDPARDFAPISRLATTSNVLVVNASLPAKSVAELVQLAKSRPGALNYASAGVGTPAHLAGEMLNLLADIAYVEAQGDYARLHTDEGSHLVRIPLSTLEERWAARGFVRIHRRHLVALGRIDELRLDAGTTSVRVGSAELQVSRRHARELRDLLMRQATG